MRWKKPDPGYTPLSRRFTLAFAVLTLGLVAIMAATFEGRFSGLMREQTRARAEAIARSIAGSAATPLLGYDYISLQQIAEGADRPDQNLLYVIIHDKEGRVAGHSSQPQLVGRTLSDPRSIRARTTKESLLQEGDFTAEAGEIPALEVDLPVLMEGTAGVRWGTVRVALSLEPLQRELTLMRLVLTLLALVGVLVGTVSAHFLSRRITRPIGQLVEASRNLADGQWAPRQKIATDDEIGILAAAFEVAAAKLTQKQKELLIAQEELRQLNAGLEEKVEKRTEELRQSRELYKLLVENAPDPFVLIQEEDVLFANQAFEDLFGSVQKVPDAGRMTISEVFHADYRVEVSNAFRDAMDRQDPVTLEVGGISRSGAPLELEVRGKCVTYNGRKALELILVDVTQRRRLMRHLVQSERLRAMGEMTTMVAHSFNNLLAIIVARSQFLQTRIKDSVIQAGLQAIQDAAHKGAEMVKRIQEFYGEEVDLKFTEVSLNAVTRDVVEYVENYWKVARGDGTQPVRFELDLQPTPFVSGAEPLLQDALKRLLSNAVESMPSGGVVRIQTESDLDKVYVRIQDSGTGMEPEILRKCYEPFFSTKGTHLRGLGVPAALGIVQRHRGRMEIQSRPGQGTRVTLSLPVAGSKLTRVGRREEPGERLGPAKVA